MNRRFARRVGVMAAGLIGIIGVSATPAMAVTQIHPPQCNRVYSTTTADYVDICDGVDVAPDHGHVRGWGQMAASSSAVHVQINQINLYNGGGSLLATTPGPANSPYGLVTEETAATGFFCPTWYQVRLIMSIRWVDGSLSSWAMPLVQYNTSPDYCVGA